MNILVVTAYPPVLNLHGGGVRMYHNIRILAEEHSVRVLSFVESDEESAAVEAVRGICDSVIAIPRKADFRPRWFSLAPFLIHEFNTPEMREAVDREFRARKIDVIQCEYLQMAQYRRPGPFSIFTAHEAVSANAWAAFQNEGDAVEKLRLFSRWMAALNYEVSACQKFDRVVTMTKEDADYLRSYTRSANIRHIPIGIDPEYFQPAVEDSSHPVEVLFMGNFRHTPNVEAAEFLLREIAPHFPDTKFVIAGPHVPATLTRARNAVFPGYVLDTRQLFHAANTIFVAPLFSGTGQRVKLLEAFAMASPVITTSVGALGFPISTGNQAFIAETASDFRSALARMLASAELRVSTGTEGRRMILEQFSWEHLRSEFVDYSHQ